GGAVAKKMVVFLQFDIEAIDVDRRQAAGTVAADGRGGYDVFSHARFALPASELREDNGGGTLWFRPDLPMASKTCQILAFRPVFAPLYLDSPGSAAISPHHPARDFSRRLFLRVFRARFCSRGRHTHSACRKSR